MFRRRQRGGFYRGSRRQRGGVYRGSRRQRGGGGGGGKRFKRRISFKPSRLYQLVKKTLRRQ